MVIANGIAASLVPKPTIRRTADSTSEKTAKAKDAVAPTPIGSLN